MKKILFLLFAILPVFSKAQCIPLPSCGGITNTENYFPRSTSLWFEQSFIAPQTEHGKIKVYVGVSGGQPVNAQFILKNSDSEIIMIDTIAIPPVNISFIFCNLSNWTSNSEVFFQEGETYSFRIEKLDTNQIPWMIYSTNQNYFLTGDGYNNLNEETVEEAPVGAGAFGPMNENEDCLFILEMDCPCPGDYNYDDQVSVLDLVMFLNAFGQISPDIDLTGNELVTVQDLQVFIGLYGQTCP